MGIAVYPQCNMVPPLESPGFDSVALEGVQEYYSQKISEVFAPVHLYLLVSLIH